MMVKFRLNEITYVQGTGNYVTIHTLTSKLLVHYSMKRIEELFMPYQFVRIHKSYLISFQHIESIEANSVTVNRVGMPISKSFKESFQEFLDMHAHKI